jgi:hypothetical protein
MDTQFFWSDVDSPNGPATFQAEDLIGLTIWSRNEWDEDDQEEGWDEGEEDWEEDDEEDDEDWEDEDEEDDEDWDDEDDDSDD